MDENEQTKEVYAHFGLAVYLAQILEHGIVNSLMYAELIPSKVKANSPQTQAEWEKEFDDFMGGQFKGTLGKLINRLKSIVSVPENLELVLSQALKKRNWLSHGYFRDRAEIFTHTDGRNRMLIELQEIQNIFENAASLLEETIRPLRLKYGFTDETLEKFHNEYVDKIQSSL